MPVGFKNFVLRGGADDADFPSREITLKQVRTVSKIAWEKWGGMVADYPPRDLIALAYVEGLYHGAMIVDRDKINMSGTTEGSASSAAASAALSATIVTKALSVRDLLESL